MRRHNLKLDMIIRGITMTRGENGATIAEMRSDYYDIFGEAWELVKFGTEEIVKYLLEIDGLMMEKLEDGLCVWYIDDIGSNISDREMDSNHKNNNNNNTTTNNNNVVITLTEASSDVTASSTDASHEAQNNSYLIPPPCVPLGMVTSSFVNEHGASNLASSAETLNFIESIENGEENATKKRQLSKCSVTDENTDKRMKPLRTNSLPLLEMNLDFHNRNSGTNGIVKKATSTEKENSLVINCGTNGFIGVLDASKDLNK